MIKKIKRMFRAMPEGLILAALFITFASLVISFILVLGAIFAGNQYKYNCNLDHRPDWHTSLMIKDSSYAYDPAYFCAQLREKMANE